MASKIYVYRDDANQSEYGVSIDENIMALYIDVVLVTDSSGSTAAPAVPTAYDDFAAALAANAGLLQPGGLQIRALILQVNGFGISKLPVLDNKGVIASGHITGMAWETTLAAYSLTGDTPFPVTPISEGDLTLSIIGYQNESRSSN